MTSSEVAIALGVGASTVKRWTDTGELKCVKTLGKHRRFAKAEVEAFAKRLANDRVAGGLPSNAATGSATKYADHSWATLLTRPGSVYPVQAALLGERAKLGSWHQVAAHMGAVIDGLAGAAASPIMAAHEHLARERLLRGLVLVNESLTVRDNAPVCLLAAAEDDEHTLGLALLELTLREAGWLPHWLGRTMTAAAIAAFVQHTRVDMVALSALATTSDMGRLAEEARVVGAACKQRAIELVLGGHGAWPEAPAYGHRVRTFTNFYGLLMRLKG